MLRGHNASAAKAMLVDVEAKCPDRMFPLPPLCDRMLTIVNEYKHVGSIISSNMKHDTDAHYRVSEACNNYRPLLGRIFGNSRVPVHVQLSLAWSLVFSRLFFGLQTWNPFFVVSAFDVLNSFYMRVLRRIIGESRFAAGAKCDSEIRNILHSPPVPAIARQARLSYLARLTRTGPRTNRYVNSDW